MASQGIGTKCRKCGEVLVGSRTPKFCPECGIPNPLGLPDGQQASATGRSTSTARGSTTTASASEGYWTGTDVGSRASTSLPATRGVSLAGPTSLLDHVTPADLSRRQPISAQDTSADNLNGASRESDVRPPSSVEVPSRQPISAQDASVSLTGASRESDVRAPSSVEVPSRQPISVQDASVSLTGITTGSTRSASYNPPVSVQDATLSNRSLSSDIGGLRQTAASSAEADVDAHQAAAASSADKMQLLSLHPPQAHPNVTAAGSSGNSSGSAFASPIIQPVSVEDAQSGSRSVSLDVAHRSLATSGARRESLVRQPTSVDLPSQQPISAQDTSAVNLIGASREPYINPPTSVELRSRQPISAQDISSVNLTGITSGSTTSASYNQPVSVQDATLSNRSGSSDIGSSTGVLRQTAPSSTEADIDAHQAAAASLENKMQPLSVHPPQAHPGVTAADSSGRSSSVTNRSSIASRVAQSVSYSGIALQVNDSNSTMLESASAGETFPPVRPPPGSSVESGQSAADLSSPVRLFAESREMTSTAPTRDAHSVARSTQPAGGSRDGSSSAPLTMDSHPTAPTKRAHSVARSTQSAEGSSSDGSTSGAATMDLSLDTPSLPSIRESTAPDSDSRLLSGTDVQPLTISVPGQGHLPYNEHVQDAESNNFGSTSTQDTGTAHSVARSTLTPATGIAHSVAHSSAGQQARDSFNDTQSATVANTLPSVRSLVSSTGNPKSVTDSNMSGHFASRSDVPSTVRSPVNSARFPNPVSDFSMSSNSARRPVAPSTGSDSISNLPSTLLGHRRPASTSQRANQERNIVTFYVTVSSSFHLEPLKDQPLIELFFPSSKSKEEHELRPVRLPSNRYGWSVEIPVEKLQDKDVTYRYAVRQNSSKVSEWLSSDTDKGDVNGRGICFAGNDGTSDDTYDEQKRRPLPYQYGVVMLPPTAAESGDQHLMREEISLGLLHMLPYPFFCLTNGYTADDVLYNFDSIIHNILSSKMFYRRNQRLDQVHLSEVLERYFKDQMRLMEEHREDAFQTEYLSYMVAVFILLIEVSKVRKYIRTSEYAIHFCTLVLLPRPLHEQPSKIIENCFTTSRVGFYDDLLDLMKDVAASGSAVWLLLVPFFPEELEDVGPFRMFFGPHFDDKYFEDVIDECVATFKSHPVQDFDVKRWYDILYDTFELSPRTGHAVVALCNKEQLRTALAAQLALPIDWCLVTYFELEHSIINLEDRLEVLRHLGALVGKFMEKPLTRYIVRQLQVAYTRMPALCKESLASVSFNDWCYVVELSKLMAVLHKAVSKIRAARAAVDQELSLHAARPEGTTGPYEKYVQCVQQWLSETLAVKHVDETASARADCSTRLQELQMWEMLFDVTWPHEVLHAPSAIDYWLDELLRVFRGRIQKASDVEIVELFCLHNFGNQLLKNEFSRIASGASDAAFKIEPFDYCLERFKEMQSLKKFGHLVSASFTKIWPSDNDEWTNMDTILPWPPFLTVIKLSCQSPPDTLNETVVKQAGTCMEMLERLCTDLSDFTGKKITYYHLSIIIKHKNIFLAWYRLRMELTAQSADLSLDIIEKCLALREKEKRGFDEVYNNLRIFSMLCGTLGNVSSVAELNKRLDDEEIKLKPVALLWSAQDPQKSQANSPEWLHFPITKTWLSPDVLQQISGVHESLLFVYFWNKCQTAFPGSSSKPNAAPERSPADVRNIWETSFKEVRKFVELLECTEGMGSLALKGDTNGATFSDGETFVTAVSSEDHSKIKAEVCRCISRHTSSNLYLLELQNAVTKRLCNYSRLRLYTKAATTMKCLIDKLGLKGSFSELDLLINAHIDKMRPLSSVTDKLVAQGEMLSSLAEQEKLNCLNTFYECTLLIKWVRENIKGGIKEVQIFVELASISTKEGSIDAQKVPILLEALTGYAPLIYDLPETTGLVGFLEACDRLWKNVENNRKLPEQLKSINIEWLQAIKAAHGEVEHTALEQAKAINSRGKYILSNDCDQPKLENLIRLQLFNEPDTEQGAPILYSYEDVSDLHNRLMLVVGREEIESIHVNNFVKMYESLLRLGEAYIKVHQSGNVWFHCFNIVFAPSASSSEDPCIRGEVYVDISKDVSSSFRIKRQKKVNDLAKEAQNICDAIELCFKEWTNYVEHCRVRTSELNFFTISQLSYLQVELAKLAKPSERDSSYNRSLVYDSMQRNTDHGALPVQVFHMLALLCQRTEDDVKSAVNSVISPEEKASISTEDSETSRSESTYDIVPRWKSLNDQHLMAKAGVLSLDCLGKVLHKLAHDSVIPKDLQSCLAGLQPGLPNLIVCTDRHIYATTMSLYHGMGRKPTRNEVLVCHEWTSQEEVDLFLKRTFEDINCLYCLVHADRLNYQICNSLDQRLNNGSSNRKVNYLLAVLCTNENSLMVIVLHRFKRTIAPQSEQDLRNWLQDQSNVSPSFVLRSKRAGMGKTLSVKTLVKLESEKAKTLSYISIQLLEQTVNVNAIVEKLHKAGTRKQCIIHINVTQEVRFGVDEFLFNLIILGSIAAENGIVWQKLANDRYVVESLLVDSEAEASSRNTWEAVHPSLELLRSVMFESPKDCLSFYLNSVPPAKPQDFASVWSSDPTDSRTPRSVHILDMDELRSNTWQRAFQYLRMHEKPYCSVNLNKPEEKAVDIVSLLLKHCGIDAPSWSELHHFVLFLSSQLKDYETSIFCNSSITGDLPGFSSFIIKFLLQMSKDFATRSLHISEASFQNSAANELKDAYISGMTWKRRWEHNHYPYLFFNSDHTTLTFFDFCVERRTGNLLKADTREIIEERVMTPVLYDALEDRGVNLSDDGAGRIRSGRDTRLTPRQEKLSKLIAVMGQGGSYAQSFDPDPKYELTKDNVKKMLAIHMRFRCGIPVIIMGETGCGKTSLIRFMCSIQVPPGVGSVIENLILMKVHGGVTTEDVIKKVKYAYDIAARNIVEHPWVDTVLFFDEANTTSAIGLIKEVLCDGTLNGEQFQRPFTDVRLRIVAAVNPYRKHSDKMIARLERAGLGFHVKAEETADVLGSVPVRHLVYRVRPLPMSMLPLVWDFGQLKPADEERYIVQFVERHVSRWPLPDRKMQDEWKSAVAKVLVKCQEFMRNQKEECSFVSLRDIERALDVMDWFISKAAHFNKHFDDAALTPSSQKSGSLDKITFGLVLALGVCYHACLQPRNRLYFRYSVASCFRRPLCLPNGEKQILNEIERSQDTVINSIGDIPDNIFRNHALKENIFMMVVCIELRIPLFLVGKPGSSKSLAKSLVSSAMHGQYSQSEFFKKLKQAMVTSFQCSPLVTSEAIIGVFKLCASYQQTSGTEKFVGVVVLDEVGLAEDAKHMPLKALHPLLEDGCEVFELPPKYLPNGGREVLENPTNYKKCAFVGISNWALDPAKMNRGIVVQRGVPSKKELVETANGICESSRCGAEALKTQVMHLTAAYLKAFNDCGRQQEFFGLRDFYSLMKMLAHFAHKKSGMPTSSQFLHAVLRNFGGLDDDKVIQIFKNELKCLDSKCLDKLDGNDPPCDPVGLIRSALQCVGANSSIEARYLLLLAENDVALNLVQDILDSNQPEIIFGSKFTKDHHLVQVCRDINRIKTCMEAGKTVVLLNLDRLYESLYDALNQYYTTFGGVNFVDLGIGMQRIKCRVHADFRLIIIADKTHAYENFPIALKNRLEKHYVKLQTLLKPDQLRIVKELQLWAEMFTDESPDDQMNESAKVGIARKTFGSFVGYSDDAPAAIVMQISDECHQQYEELNPETILERAKYRLLLSATPGAVIRAEQRFSSSEYNHWYDAYFVKQCHGSLHACLQKMVDSADEDLFLQITTHYKLLSRDDVKDIEREMPKYDFEVTAPLQAFETERQFSKEVGNFFKGQKSQTSILMIPCEAGDREHELIACARYIIKREYKSIISSSTIVSAGEAISTPPEARRFVVVLLIRLNNFACVRGFHGGRWINVHVDDLRSPKVSLLDANKARNKSIGELLSSTLPEDKVSVQETGQSRMQSDAYVLLSGCVHEALIRLEQAHQENSVVVGNVSHQRLGFLFGIFPTDHTQGSSSAPFAEAFARHLVNLIKEKDKDERLLGVDWLYDEAALPANVLRHCTFRRSMEQSIKKRIVPAFAAIVAYIDYDSNLLLFSESSNAWIKELWLTLFDSANFFKHLSSTMIDLVATDQKLKVPVIRRGPKEKSFRTQFPFSWILLEELDSPLKAADSSAPDSVISLRHGMSKHPFNKWAEHPKNKEHREEAVRLYVSDLLATWFGSPPTGFTEAVRKSLELKIDTTKVHHIEYVHWYCFSNLPKYGKLSELIEVTDQRTTEWVRPFESTTSFNGMLKCTMEYLMNDLESSLHDGKTDNWRSRIDECYCIAHELFESYQEIESIASLRPSWNKIVSASLLYDVLTTSKGTASKQVPESINIFFEQFRADLTTLGGFKELNKYLEAKWKSLHLDDVDLSRLRMYITSDVVLANSGSVRKDLVDYIFDNYVKRTTLLVAPPPDFSKGTRWQTVPFYLYCLLKQTGYRVYDEVCEILDGPVDVDESYAKVLISCLEVYYRELKTRLPDLSVDKNVKAIAKLRAVATTEVDPHYDYSTSRFEEDISDLIKNLCPHQSKPKIFWLQGYFSKKESSRAMEVLPRCSAAQPGCVACKQSMWDDSCIPTVESFDSDLKNYCDIHKVDDADHSKSLNALRAIMKRRKEIETLQYLYDIVDLSVTLQRKFSGRLNEQNVYTMSASTFIRKYAQGELTRQFKCFILVWNKVWTFLKDRKIFYKSKEFYLLEEMCKPIDENSPMRSFLFTSTDGSACPLALVTYLAELQNDILNDFGTILGRKPKRVDLLSMKKGHTVLLADDSDLLSAILAHYSFSPPNPGEKATFHYDYSSIQQRLVNILIRRARRLVIPGPESSGDTVDLPMFRFHELVVTAEHVSNIDIRQESLDLPTKEAIQNQLCLEVNDLRDSCDAVEKGIAFLHNVSASYNEDTSLKEYMKALNVEIDQTLEKCQLRHVKSLWLLLTFELNRALAWIGQKCYDGVDSCYKKSIEGYVDVMDSLQKYLERQQRAVLACLLKHFHDFIVLKLTTTQGKQDRLFIKLCEFPSSERLPEKLEDDLRNVLAELSNRFDNIGLEHCVPVWLGISEICKNKT